MDKMFPYYKKWFQLAAVLCMIGKTLMYIDIKNSRLLRASHTNISLWKICTCEMQMETSNGVSHFVIFYTGKTKSGKSIIGIHLEDKHLGVKNKARVGLIGQMHPEQPIGSELLIRLALHLAEGINLLVSQFFISTSNFIKVVIAW